MTPSQRRRAFEAAVRGQVRKRGLAIDAGVIRLLGTLAEMQAAIRAELSAQPSHFALVHLPQLMREVEGHIERWRQVALGTVSELLDEGWKRGPKLVEAPLRAAGIRLGRVMLPTTLLEEVKDYTADRIGGVGRLARQRIERHVQLTVMGGQSIHDAMRGVGAEIDAPGPLRAVSFRAETIVRTEVGRIHSGAADRRLVAAAEQVPGLQKQWLWSGKARPLHRAVSGQIRDPDESFELPDGVIMKYPRVGGAPVEHVANCGCESVPYKADW